jgi:hypothetical protein
MKMVSYWYKIKCATSNGEAFFLLIKNNEFTPTSEIGFKIDSIDSSQLRFNFIVKEDRIEEVEDPFGNSVAIRHVSYDKSYMIYHKKSMLLEVISPGRKFKKALSLLDQNHKGDMAFIPLAVNLRKFVNVIKEACPGTEIKSLETEAFLINQRTNCQIHFQALVDVSQDVEHFLQNREFTAKRLHVTTPTKMFLYELDLDASGRNILNFDPRATEHAPIKKMLTDALHPKTD